MYNRNHLFFEFLSEQNNISTAQSSCGSAQPLKSYVGRYHPVDPLDLLFHFSHVDTMASLRLNRYLGLLGLHPESAYVHRLRVFCSIRVCSAGSQVVPISKPWAHREKKSTFRILRGHDAVNPEIAEEV